LGAKSNGERSTDAPAAARHQRDSSAELHAHLPIGPR